MIAQGSVITLANLTSFSTVNNFDWRIYRPVSIPVEQPTTIQVLNSYFKLFLKPMQYNFFLQLAFVGFCGSAPEDAIAIDDIVVTFDTSATTEQPNNTPPDTCPAITTDFTPSSSTVSSTAATYPSTTVETISSRSFVDK